MYVYARLCVPVHAPCICVSECLPTCVCTCPHVCLSMLACVHVCMHTWMCACMHGSTCACVCACVAMQGWGPGQRYEGAQEQRCHGPLLVLLRVLAPFTWKTEGRVCAQLSPCCVWNPGFVLWLLVFDDWNRAQEMSSFGAVLLLEDADWGHAAGLGPPACCTHWPQAGLRLLTPNRAGLLLTPCSV